MAVERQREYETVYILRPSAGEEDGAKARERVEGVIENAGGHVLRFDDWGQRDLAYEIRDSTEGKRFDRGKYQYYRYLAPGDAVAEVERNLRLFDPVVKYLTVKLDEDLIPDERLQRPTEEEAIDVLAGEEE